EETRTYTRRFLNRILEWEGAYGLPPRRDLLALRSFQAQQKPKGKLRALFLYLRGPGTTFVCGEGSTPVGMMELAGLENAAKGIRECKPMTA
ncbi:hypothetical protein L6232_23515, partial [Shewanella sp. C31]|nr:hypothetical protein [Shewanella electrica]